MIRTIIFSSLLTMVSNYLMAQAGIRDSSIVISSLEIGYTAGWAEQDLLDRTNFAHVLSAQLSFKRKSNLVWGFGGTVDLGDYNESGNGLEHLNSDVGFPIDKNGLLVEINQQFFGYTLFGSLGKLWATNLNKPNSGFYTGVQFGFMQHKISYVYNGDDLPSLSGDYRKGYDHLSNGLMLAQNIGYKRYSVRNYLNYEIGFNITQGFTKNRRDWNYDEMRRADEARFDLRYGPYVKLVVPIYR